MRKLIPSRQAISLLLLCLPAFLFAQSTLALSAKSPRVNDKMERKVIAVDICHFQSDKAVYKTNEGDYGEQEGMNVNKDRFNESVSHYDGNGNITRLLRNGKRQDGSYGKIDDLSLDYSGNRLIKVFDSADPVNYSGSTDFKDDDNSQSVEYGYDGMGAMTYDRNRGIALVEYDNWGNPLRIQFTNGNTTEYVYDALGSKLRVVHTTAIPNIEVAIGSKHVLTASEILSTDRTDYLDGGKLVLHNGRQEMYLFEGGYCSISNSNAISFHYYNTDHLGNIREVVGDNGVAEQVTHYYPFGNVFCDGSSTDYDVQPYKYNGKEQDLIHGLNTYDYGARQLAMALPRWDRVDPLAEETPGISPYVYCENNPVNAIDPDGRSIWTKIAKVGAKVGARVYRYGWKELGKAATYAEAVSDIAKDVNTVFDGKASTKDKVVAGISLASEVLPVSISDVKAAGKGLKSVIRDSKKTGKSFSGIKPKSINQLQKDVERGKAPKEIERFDMGKTKGEQPHVHFKDDTALNKDGTIKEGKSINITSKTRKYLEQNGWKFDKDKKI